MPSFTSAEPSVVQRSWLTLWLHSIKTETSLQAKSKDEKTDRVETAYEPSEASAAQIHKRQESNDDNQQKAQHHLPDSHFSFRRRFSSLAFSSISSKRSSASQSHSHPPTTYATQSYPQSKDATPRTSVSTRPRTSFPCACRMPSCPLCQRQQNADLEAATKPGSVKAGRRRAESAKRRARALDDPDDFLVSITRSATGFSVSRDYSYRNWTPRTATFRESLERARAASWPQIETSNETFEQPRSSPWPRAEPRIRFQDVDFKTDKGASQVKVVAGKERWKRENELTSHLADLDTEGVAPDQVSRRRKPERAISLDRTTVQKGTTNGCDIFVEDTELANGYDNFVDEQGRGFLGGEPL